MFRTISFLHFLEKVLKNDCEARKKGIKEKLFFCSLFTGWQSQPEKKGNGFIPK